MSIDITEVIDVTWLDEHHQFSLDELADLSGLSVVELQVLIDCEALAPVMGAVDSEPASATTATEARFGAACLTLARTASRLRHDFDLDVNALALTLRLLQHIHGLEAELLHLRAQRPR